MTLRETLDHWGIAPKKSLGQNFMAEAAVLEQMADAADLGPGDAVLEIGAGLGDLTAVLAARARRVVALEVDRRMLVPLGARFAGQPHVEIVHADILKTDLLTLLGPDARAYKAVANVPYYITSAILRTLLESPSPPTVIAVTVQWEVAERVTAAPDEMSLLTVSVQIYGLPEIVRKLKPGVFYPRPNVDSALLRITPHPAGPPLPAEDLPGFFRLAKAGFSQPRKQIKNPLAAGLRLDKDQAAALLDAADIDPTRRAETLSIAEWVALYRTFSQFESESHD
jgi:16S rRNA (adenine1518-N6/adenine1519-N6)-dimethyltransferase